MRGFYSVTPRIWKGRRRRFAHAPGPDLYAPGSDGFASRNRKTTHVLPSGLMLETVGADPAGEFPSVTLKEPEGTPEALPAPAPQPARSSSRKSFRSLDDHRPLGRSD